MAKVTGPLFSGTASGNMARGNMQYRSGHWGSHVYKPMSPDKQNKGKASAAQAAQRAQFLTVRDSWNALTTEAKQLYQEQATKIGGLNGWNLFVSLGLARSKLPDAAILTKEGLAILSTIGEIMTSD